MVIGAFASSFKGSQSLKLTTHLYMGETRDTEGIVTLIAFEIQQSAMERVLSAAGQLYVCPRAVYIVSQQLVTHLTAPWSCFINCKLLFEKN
jgi:hypothetical protein